VTTFLLAALAWLTLAIPVAWLFGRIAQLNTCPRCGDEARQLPTAGAPRLSVVHRPVAQCGGVHATSDAAAGCQTLPVPGSGVVPELHLVN
jgi:hypothetical protein